MESSTPAALPGTVERFLKEQQVPFSLDSRHADNAGDQVVGQPLRARAIALGDNAGIVLAVLPENRILDITSLGKQLRRDLQPLETARFLEVFSDCDLGCCPPLGRAYDVLTAVDIKLYSSVALTFDSGHRQTLVTVSTPDFQRLVQTVVLGRFSLSPQEPVRAQAEDGVPDMSHLFPARAKQAVKRCETLPPLPETTRELLELATDPNAGARELAGAIEADAAVAARILRYANSSLYGFSGRIADLQSAIARVLGFDVAMGIAVGMCLGKDVRIPPMAPLGLDSYRRHSFYCATLAAQLARQAPTQLSLKPGKAYLAGLLHNLGLLFLGQLFPDQYRLLGRTLVVNPHAAITDVEMALLESTHVQLGLQLLQEWHLPDEIIAAVAHCQEEDYQGEHAGYAHLVALALRLLDDSELLGYRVATAPSAVLTQRLGLDEAQLQFALATVFDHHEALDQLIEIAA